jgi:hypothetical protein
MHECTDLGGPVLFVPPLDAQLATSASSRVRGPPFDASEGSQRWGSQSEQVKVRPRLPPMLSWVEFDLFPLWKPLMDAEGRNSLLRQGSAAPDRLELVLMPPVLLHDQRGAEFTDPRNKWQTARVS